MQTLIEIHLPGGGSVGVVVPWLNLDAMDWWEYLEPLAQLVAAAHPQAEWIFTPLADGQTDKGALVGH
jgi:hypothetical protein